MKAFYLLIVLIALSCCVSAQNRIHFKNGDLSTGAPLKKKQLGNGLLQNIRFHKKSYALIQFSKLPNTDERKELQLKGILLFDYLPGNAFMAELPDSVDVEGMKNYNVSGVYKVDRSFKISKILQQHISENYVDRDKLIAVSFFGTISKQEVTAELK